MFDAIPIELRQLPQWVVWREELTDKGKPTKVPYCPHTGNLASSTNPATWAPFETALAVYQRGGFNGIGFILSDRDPYTFIDLDDPYATDDGTPKHRNPQEISQLQQLIFGAMNSYAELSPSGKGLHIIVKGKVPSGRRRNAVEVYSSARFMTMTGNVYFNSPINPAQEQLNWLYEKLGGAPQVYTYAGDDQDKYPDNEICDRAANASNGELFIALYKGEWQGRYTSQSEADFALIDILAFWTTSRHQIARIFRNSALGQREKANRDKYVYGMIDRSFDRHPPPLDMDGIINVINAQFGMGGAAQSTPPTGEPVSPPAGTTERTSNPAVETLEAPGTEGNPYYQPIPGLLGSIAAYIYSQAVRPVPEIALAGAIGLMAGICGRAYNVSGTGLNQYVMLLAPTGRNKEAIKSGIGSLMNAVADINQGGCPGAMEFMGPSVIASGQALFKYLDKHSKSFVSVLGEVDGTLKQFTSKNANAALIMLKQMWLDCYGKSGRGQMLEPMIYSDKDKNTSAIPSPAFSIIGEGTPQKFYGLLDEEMVSDGLLPRFTVIEYTGRREHMRPENIGRKPDPHLVKALAQVCGYALMLNQQNKTLDVQMTADAAAFLHEFDREVDGVINAAGNDAIEQLWNRAYLKAAKLSALIAVGINHINPVIDIQAAQYAVSLTKHQIERLVHKFQIGDIGSDTSKQWNETRRIINKLYQLGEDNAHKADMSREMYRDRLIPYRYIQSRLVNLAAFRNDRQGPTRAIDNTIRALIDGGVLAQVGQGDLVRYGKNAGKFFICVDPSWLAQGV